jgi:predicted Rdx family selenoprotein
VAAEIKSELGFTVQLVRGSGGIFQVRADGHLVFDKHQLERFPEDGEVVRLLKAR